MARPRDPEEIAKLKGADKKNPQRYRGTVPKTDRPLGGPPKHFAAGEKAVWKEIVDNALPGVLTAADFAVVEQAAVLLHESREIPKENRRLKRRLLQWEKQMDQLKKEHLKAPGAEEKAEVLKMIKEHRRDQPKLMYWPASRISQLHSLVSKLGMSPTDRQKLRVPEGKSKPGDPSVDDDDFMPLKKDNIH